MWYVNIFETTLINNVVEGFILTMWYVNINSDTSSELLHLVLY